MSAAQLRVEYTYDPESQNWGFVVPTLGIVGGAETREDAEEQAIEAIAFTLESEPDSMANSQGEVRYLRVTVDK